MFGNHMDGDLFQEQRPDRNDDGEDEEWPDDNGPAETITCPACSAEVYEEAPQCPVCGEYMIHETRVLVGKSVWYVLLAILGIVSVIVVLSGLLVV